MNRLIIVFSTLLIIVMLMGFDSANAEEGHHAIGIQAGQVGLSSDVGSRYGNALGFGAFFKYAASDWMDFELNFLTSKHTNNSLSNTQNVFGLGARYNIDQFDNFVPYLKGGAEFISSSQDIPGLSSGTSTSATAFGLLLGAGGEFQLGEQFLTGLELGYHSAFETSASLANGSSTKTIQSFYSVMLRFGYVFGGDSKTTIRHAAPPPGH